MIANINTLQNKLTEISDDVNFEITKEYFNSIYGYNGIPVIFRNAFQNLAIKNKWTLSYLADRLAQPEVLEDLCHGDDVLKMNLKDYLPFKSADYYYKTSRHLDSKLASDYSTPVMFNCWYANTLESRPTKKLSWLYVGLEGSFSEVHRDVWHTSAWNYLVSGRKLWFIYPASFSNYIAGHKDQFSVRNFLTNPSQVVDGKPRPLFCVQQPGELIFVPGTLYHSVINLEDSVSLTENFVNETNYDDVRGYFKERDNVKNKRFIEQIVKEGFQNLPKYKVTNV